MQPLVLRSSIGRRSLAALSNRIKYRPLAIATAATILLIIAIIVAGIWWLYTLTIMNTRRELTNLSLVISEQVSRSMETTALVLQAAQEQVRHLDRRSAKDRFQLHRTLSDLARALPHIRTVAVTDRMGDLVAISRQYPAPVHNIGDREYFIKVKSGAYVPPYYIGLPANSVTTGERSITVSQPIRNQAGSFDGIVRVGLETRYFEDQFAAIEIGRGSAITIIRDDGILLLRSPWDATATGRNLSGNTVFKTLLAHTDFGLTWHKSPVDGVRRFVAARRLHGTPLIVVVSVTASAVLAPWKDQAMVIGAIGVLAIGILLVLFLMAAKQIGRREQRMLLAIDQAVSAHQAKSHFLANMSHELRTPLNAIIGFAEMIRLRMLGGEISRDYMDRVDIIHQSAEHLLRLVGQLLDIEKIDSGNHVLNIQPIDLAVTVDKCFSMVATDAKRQDIQLINHVPKEGIFCGDQRVLIQILLNLIANAVKYAGNGSVVQVSAQHTGKDNVMLSVEDNGSGIPEAMMEHLFEPFQNSTAYIRRPNSGYGLGLSITEKLAKLHGGKVEIAHRTVRGTTVNVCLASYRKAA